MLKLFEIFFKSKGGNQWIVLLSLVFAGLAEGIGLATLLPVFSLVGSGSVDASSDVNRAILEVFAVLRLEPTLSVLLIVVVGGFVVKGALVLMAMRYVGYAVADVATERRATLIDNILQANWAYFSRQPLGRIANAVAMEAQRCGEAYLLVAMALATGIQMLMYLFLAFIVSWQLAAASIVVGVAITLSLWTFIRMSRKAGRKQYKRGRELMIHLTDALINIKPLKAMARQGQFEALFSERIADVRNALRREVISKQLLKHLPEPAVLAIVALGFYILVERIGMPVPEVLILALLMLRTVGRIQKMQRRFQEAVVVEAAYWNVHNMVEESLHHRELAHGVLKPTLDKGCEVRDVSFAFDENQVIDHLSLEIPANQLTLVIGHSGTGKTTLTDLILGLYNPDAGQILVDGVPLDQLDLVAWRGMIGYVPQELVLFHDSVLANVTLRDRTLTREMAEAALKAAGAWEFVSKLPDGMDTTVGERGATLSGGQRQRIALARGLVHNPRLLILDEVTSALDKNTELAICKSIKALSSSMTVLAISHRPAWINISDNVYELGVDENVFAEEVEEVSVA